MPDGEMAHFDERSGVVECPTPWGSWHQTMDEVAVLINVPKGTRGKDVTVKIEVSCVAE